MRVAYADPPYIGQAQRHYAHDPQCAEVDHDALIARLLRDYPDGWALSLSSVTLEEIILHLRAHGLRQSAGDYRVCAWVKPFASFKPGVTLAYAWEPIILRGGRKRSRAEATVRDWVSANITLQRGLSGAKPPQFCWWLFEALGLQPGDEFHDLFPGSGAVSREWERWSRQGLLVERIELTEEQRRELTLQGMETP